MSSLLSRVAEHLYWSARYLERAEDTARIVREHTNVIVDLPTSVPFSWEPLLAITGSIETFAEAHSSADEASIVSFLVSELTNSGSIHSSVIAARENLRSCREVIPAMAWVVINDLHLWVQAHHDEGVARRSRARFCDHLVSEHQRLIGVLTTTMTRDEAYTMLRLGRHIERADMATRVLDVGAGNLLVDRPGPDLYDVLLWSAMLRSVAANQMHRRVHRDGELGPSAIEFVLHEGAFPRSVRYCMASARESARRLPNHEATVAACDAVLAMLSTVRATELDANGLHRVVDELQIAIGQVHAEIANAYFSVAVGES